MVSMIKILAVMSGLLLILAIVTIVVITKRLVRPIEILKNGLEKISYGNFSHRIQIKSNDEFSYLGSQFNEMAERIASMMAEIESSQRVPGEAGADAHPRVERIKP